MDQKSIEWKINCRSSAGQVYKALTTSEGRRAFWAERALQVGDTIHFEFPNGLTHTSKIIESTPDKLFCFEYFGVKTTFKMHPNDDGSCTVQLKAENVPEAAFEGFYAGWVSVLLNLKAFVDHGVDLRNHHPGRTWDQKFADN